MKKMLLTASALLGAALAHTSCQAPAPPAPKAEPIAVGQQTATRQSEPAKSTNQPAAQQKVVARPAAPGIFYGPSRLFIEKPHLRKVK
ncbi:MAG: hypothetical protein ACRYG7_47415 [Janthinobacterium lividum]